ncbi:hypothetical protein [Vampirovibrio chlorellavorus]|uniref:hypothetical protein n=1 Tax=Vampirovibrio chlorellavorus TaxID=758823 RepID=UPI0026F0D2E6|nr:hypothetical protein [Vampirovibrio chlorellavorus]
MTVPLESVIQKSERPSGVLLALLLLLLLGASGCEPTSGAPPGARPGSAIPGRPGTSGSVNPSVPSSGLPRGNAPARSSLKPGGAQTTPVETAASLVPTKPDLANPLDSGKNSPNAVLTPSASGVNSLGPAARVEQAGNTVELASAIIAAKANPFLDWLPKPLLTSDLSGDTSSATAATATPTDPFDGVTLLGVMSHGKKAMALIGVGDGRNQFAEQGSVITLGAGMAKVTAIRSDSVDFQLLGKEPQIRTLTLPDIIGYSPSASSGGNIGGEASEAQLPSGLSVPGATADNKSGSALENLKQLFEQSSGGKVSSSPAAGAQLNLQER